MNYGLVQRSGFSATYTMTTAQDVVADLRRLKDLGLVDLKEIAKACLGGSTLEASKQQRLSRWMAAVEAGGRWKALKPDELRKIAAQLARIENVPASKSGGGASIPDAMFFGLFSWFEGDEQTLTELQQFAGAYTIYRASYSAPGRVAVGNLTIQISDVTGAVSTVERHLIEETGQAFEISGYLGRRRGKHYILSQHDEGNNAFVQFSYLHGVDYSGSAPAGELARVTGFAGVLSDIQADTFYSGRFVCVQGKVETPHVARMEDLAPAIQHKLNLAPRILPGPDGALGYVATF